MPALVAAAGRGGYILDGFPANRAAGPRVDAISAELNIPLEAAV